jgi:hypothetical protein
MESLMVVWNLLFKDKEEGEFLVCCMLAFKKNFFGCGNSQ